MTKIGKLNKLLVIEKPIDTDDAGGGKTRTWQIVCKAWCEVKPASASAQANAMQLQAPITHKITTRYQDGITPDMRAIWSGRTFEFKTAKDPEENRRFLEITAEEK